MDRQDGPRQGGLRLVVLGAGLIGGYVGGRLAHGGANVAFVGRPAQMAVLAEGGMTLTDLEGFRAEIPAGALSLASDPAGLAAADVVLLAVKSQATESAAADIAAHARPDAAVVSLQNGVSNPERLRALLPGRTVVAGMVPYNVASPGPGHFHQGTSGAIALEDGPTAAALAPLFKAAGLALDRHGDMRAILWAKLLINLNNAINALSGKPLAAQLAIRDYRRCFALCQAEGLRLLKAAGIAPAQLGALPAQRMPFVLSLPDWLFKRISKRGGTPRIDRHARSSMAEDLAAGRKTEVDHINGEILALARKLGRAAPVNARVIELIHAAEAGAPPWPADRLWRELKALRT
ncbi:2-dehydropantoate 2-reductase [Zavarzinia compransoris]|uniref:2-dehydropantoate 2-reductase n=1 Tax=Zavarzinia marina TaxID=2911065 RepID=UPI001F2DF437|nr:2-dehydropantoate 2-reductase [Zavarzinia marina]MCF4164591.1 2-dehydropantoate 2-reductase [Zavarzinia marina]